ncbi:MAG: AAA family ATPase [Burkholderiales bacterium]
MTRQKRDDIPTGYCLLDDVLVPEHVERSTWEDRRRQATSETVAHASTIASKEPWPSDEGSSRDLVGMEVAKRPTTPSAPTEEEIELAAMLASPHRVSVVNMGDVREAAMAAASKTRSTDAERNKGMKALTTRLLEAGGYRDVARPADRHEALLCFLQDAPNMRELGDMLRVALDVAHLGQRPMQLDPVLLVGQPGIGKTWVAEVLARVLETKRYVQSYAVQGGAGNVLSGADKHWSNACMGAVFQALAEGTVANPVFLCDELDKAGLSLDSTDRKRDPLSELLPLLERSTAREHRDRYSEIRCDASHISWIATANTLKGLPTPLLSRFRIVHVKPPTVRESFEILQMICRNVLRDLGIEGEIKRPGGAVARVLAEMTPRLMRRTITAAVGGTLSAGRREITMEDLERALGLDSDQRQALH